MTARIPAHVVIACAVAVTTFGAVQLLLDGRGGVPAEVVDAAPVGEVVTAMSGVPAPPAAGRATVTPFPLPAVSVSGAGSAATNTEPEKPSAPVEEQSAASPSARKAPSSSRSPGERPAAASPAAECRDGEMLGESKGRFVCAGGAPLYVSSFKLIGGPRPPDRGISAEELSALRQYPRDGTLVSVLVAAPSTTERRYYVFAGGGPVGVSEEFRRTVFRTKPDILIGSSAISNAGDPGVWDHVRPHPAPGTVLRAGSTYYQVGELGLMRGTNRRAGAVDVDPAAIANRGRPEAPWSHLR